MQILGQLAQGRDNNLNLVRIVAAAAVLVAHAWPIALGPQAGAPRLLDMGLGHAAVVVFFAISGFLIFGSFERSATHRRFIAARVLRLWPGLVVSLIFVACIIGPIVWEGAAGRYWAEAGPLGFIARNSSLVWMQYEIPGVFTSNPYTAIEGSIWTLFPEVACYAGLFVLGCAGLLRRGPVLAVALAVWAVIWLAVTGLDLRLPHPVLDGVLDLSLPFAIGMGFWRWRDRLVLSAPVALGAIVLAAVLPEGAVQQGVAVLALSYASFWLGYVPGGMVRAYNRLGDYSYGLYIYAFPVQGLMVWAVGPMGPWTNIALSLPATMVLAVASWHLVERPALHLLKRRTPRPSDDAPPIR